MTSKNAHPQTQTPAQRLDQLLVARGLFESRSRARDAIQRGTVTVNGTIITKPGQIVADDADLAVDDPAQGYVSRAALKLIAALDHFDIDPRDRICLDIGASTGGFTEVLLERGASHVVAVDVGHDQMNERIASDERVTNLEGLNARNLTHEDIDEVSVDLVVSDVSFISLKLALPPALQLAEPGALCILLVKPQFEAGRENIGKGGLLRDPSSAPVVAESLKTWLEVDMGWQALGLIPSPIAGGDGNIEYLLAGKKPAATDTQET